MSGIETNKRYYAVVNGKRVGPLFSFTADGLMNAARLAAGVARKSNAARYGIMAGEFTDAQLEIEEVE